jgi:hypothetical protein
MCLPFLAVKAYKKRQAQKAADATNPDSEHFEGARPAQNGRNSPDRYKEKHDNNSNGEVSGQQPLAA